MNRQQRRIQSKIVQTEQRIKQQLYDRQSRVNEVEVELYFTAMGLAINQLYGWKNGPISRIWERTDQIIGMVADGKETLEGLKEKLRNIADVECSFS